ncbi:fatty acid desaturase family protein [Nocardia sp. NPDC004068]|uniref:fatty acid desaturase family protein n=1 Tax=Nocardia sp. NPDC004068 TaxID=3364303 RepID=UPI0036CCF86B
MTEPDLAAELDELRRRILDDLGAADARYIRTVIRTQRTLELAGRAVLFGSLFPPAWLAGVTCLSLSKILDNWEIGHNVLHGQWDWLRDPRIHSAAWEWDMYMPAAQWKDSHVHHHLYTNVVDRDRDLGFGYLRISPEQPWHPLNLAQPLYAIGLAVCFDAMLLPYDAELERVLTGRKDIREIDGKLRAGARKTLTLATKEYLLFPLLTGPCAATTLTANLASELVRNLWSAAIVLCGHLPAGIATFPERCLANESRGDWYARQLRGSADISGGRILHVLSGHLSFQIEHHLFPDLPSNRYPEIAPEVRRICARHGLPYHRGRLVPQLLTVVGKILRYSLPARISNAASVSRSAAASIPGKRFRSGTVVRQATMPKSM